MHSSPRDVSTLPVQVMSTIRDGKFYLSLCVCIQLLKITKFASALVPKMDLAPLVLKKVRCSRLPPHAVPSRAARPAPQRIRADFF